MKTASSYLSVQNKAEGFYKEKGSKFLGFALPASSEGEVRELLSEIRKTYHDARHYCYAYIIGATADIFRANDDGEPNHSAGDPILGQIRSKGLTNTLVVVVRYFGGSKLGVPGLINAYKTAAREALDNAGMIEIVITDQVIIDFPYEKTSEVMRLISDFEVSIVEQSFLESCQIKGDITPGQGEILAEKLFLAGVPDVDIISTDQG